MLQRLVCIALVILFVSCTAAQRDWRNGLYLDVSAGGTEEYKDTVSSGGVSYPLIWNVWITAGAWSNFYGDWGPYWGLSYSWAPFTREEHKKKP